MRPRVLLLHDKGAAGARADTADVLAEAAHVAAALAALGHEPIVVPLGLDLGVLEAALERHRPLAVFNLIESLDGRAEQIHAVPARLEALGVPFTGCGADAQRATSNKLLAKRRLRTAGIATPALYGSGIAEAGARWIVKSVWEHASFGIDDESVVPTRGVEPLRARRRAEHGGRWFAEAFVEGRELNVALLARADEVVTLPAAEIAFDGFPAGKPRIVGYAAKWHGSSFESLHTPRRFAVEPPLAAELARIARACWRLFGLAGYARVDFRVDDRGSIHVLEVNANPCLSADAGFAAALDRAGIGFTSAVSDLVADALRRARAGPRTAGSQTPRGQRP